MSLNVPYSPITMRSPDRSKKEQDHVSQVNGGSLHQPLLLLNDNLLDENKKSISSPTESQHEENDEVKKSEFDDVTVNQNYANNAPKIF